MIYCPHCKKPSARDTGPCPHCGGPLTPSKVVRDPASAALEEAGKGKMDIGLEKTMMAAPGAVPAASNSAPASGQGAGAQKLQLKPNPFADQPAQTQSLAQQFPKLELKKPQKPASDSLKLEPEHSSPGGQAKADPGFEVERSLIVMSGTGADLDPSQYSGVASTGASFDLDIDSLPPPAPIPPPEVQVEEVALPQKQDQDDFKVREIAKFGIPAAGVVGTLKYWLKVRKRLDELAVEYDQAVEKCRGILGKKKEACAELGKQAGLIGLGEETVTPLIKKAVAAGDELSNRERARLESASEHKAKIEPIDIKIKFVEKEAAPFYEKEKQALEEQRKVVVARRRIEVKKEAVDAELKAIDDQIEKLQLEFADLERPKEERDRLLKEIGMVDRNRHPLMKQVEQLEKELSVLDEPLARVDAKLKDVRGFLNAKLDEIKELNVQKNKLLREFNRLDSDAQKQLEQESSKVESLWAAVGEKIVEKGVKEPKLDKLQTKALASISDAEQAEKRVELISKARDSYDKETVAKAKKIATIIGAAIGVLIIVLLILGKM